MLQRGMKLSPTYSSNKRVLLTKTKLPSMFWNKDLAKVDQIAKISSNICFASGCKVIHFPQSVGKKHSGFLSLSGDSFCVGRDVTGFLDMAPGFWLADIPECELLTFKLSSQCTFHDLEARDEEVLATLPVKLKDRLLLRRVSISGDGERASLGGLSIELQYFFGWT